MNGIRLAAAVFSNVLVLSAMGAALAAPDTAPRSPLEVEVRRGESMGLYGRWARVPMRPLYEGAGLRWNERLRVGRKLTLSLTDNEKARFQQHREEFHKQREAGFATAESREYVVRRGDNPWRIARRLHVPVWALEKLNPGKSLSRLQVGEKIRVPPGRGDAS